MSTVFKALGPKFSAAATTPDGNYIRVKDLILCVKNTTSNNSFHSVWRRFKRQNKDLVRYFIKRKVKEYREKQDVCDFNTSLLVIDAYKKSLSAAHSTGSTSTGSTSTLPCVSLSHDVHEEDTVHNTSKFYNILSNVHTTDDNKYIRVKDVLALVKGNSNEKYLSDCWSKLQKIHPQDCKEVLKKNVAGFRETQDVCGLKTAMRIVMICTGNNAAHFRKICSTQLSQLLNGDPRVLNDFKRGYEQTHPGRECNIGVSFGNIGVTSVETNSGVIANKRKLEPKCYTLDEFLSGEMKVVDVVEKIMEKTERLKQNYCSDNHERAMVKRIRVQILRNIIQKRDKLNEDTEKGFMTAEEIMQARGVRMDQAELSTLMKDFVLMKRKNEFGFDSKIKKVERYVNGKKVFINSYPKEMHSQIVQLSQALG